MIDKVQNRQTQVAWHKFADGNGEVLRFLRERYVLMEQNGAMKKWIDYKNGMWNEKL